MPKGVYIHVPKHGLSGTPIYRAWQAMRERCLDPRHPDWKNYGGRGITVCGRWHKFENFAADMGAHPGKGWSLDRIDNNGSYEPGNCRWATRATQQQNTRKTILTEALVRELRRRYVRGVNQLFPGNRRELAKEFGVSYGYFHNLVAGMSWLDG